MLDFFIRTAIVYAVERRKVPVEKKGGIAAKFAELDRIAEKLSGGAELEEAMKLYEKGMKLAAEIRDYLAKAEKKIQVIGADGSVTNKEEHELGKESV